MCSRTRPLPAAKIDERYLIYYRKGYCELFGAVVTGESALQDAAKDFTGRRQLAEEGAGAAAHRSAALAAIARLEQGRMADYDPTRCAIWERRPPIRTASRPR